MLSLIALKDIQIFVWIYDLIYYFFIFVIEIKFLEIIIILSNKLGKFDINKIIILIFLKNKFNK